MKLCASPCVAKGMQKSIFVELIRILIDLLIFLPALYIAGKSFGRGEGSVLFWKAAVKFNKAFYVLIIGDLKNHNMWFCHGGFYRLNFRLGSLYGHISINGVKYNS